MGSGMPPNLGSEVDPLTGQLMSDPSQLGSSMGLPQQTGSSGSLLMKKGKPCLQPVCCATSLHASLIAFSDLYPTHRVDSREPL